MAMRIYSREEFFAELKKRGLMPTQVQTYTGRLWRTDSGQIISVPEHSDSYPESVLDMLLEQVDMLYHTPNQFK